MGPATLGDLKTEEGSTSGEAPHWGWCELSWDRRGASFSLGREHGSQHVGTGQSEASTQGADLSPAHPA